MIHIHYVIYTQYVIHAHYVIHHFVILPSHFSTIVPCNGDRQTVSIGYAPRNGHGSILVCTVRFARASWCYLENWSSDHSSLVTVCLF